MHELLKCLACSRGFITQAELLEHLEQHKMTPSKRILTTDGGNGTPDEVLKRRRTGEAANLEALQMDPETAQPGRLFKSRPLGEGTGSYVIDDVSAKRERFAVAINKHRRQRSRVEQTEAETLDQVGFTNSNHRDMDIDILLTKPEPSEDDHPGPAHRTFREVWVKLYECTICCTPFPDKESCERHFEAHLTKPALPQVHLGLHQLPKHIAKPTEQKLAPSILSKAQDSERHEEDLIPSSNESVTQSEAPVGVLPKTEHDDEEVSTKPGRMYLCYVCFEEFTDKDACNVHIELHTQTIRQTRSHIPKHAVPGTSLHSKVPNVSTADDQDPAVSSNVNHSKIREDPWSGISDDDDFRPDPDDSSSCGDTGEERSPYDTKTESSLQDQEHDYTIPPPVITYQCHICKKGYAIKDACVKHVLTHIKQPGEPEGTADADNLGDSAQQGSLVLPPQGRIVSVVLEKVTNTIEECEDGRPRNQYVVSFHQEGPENSPTEPLPTLYQCQTCKMKFKDRSSCQGHVKMHSKQHNKTPVDTRGAPKDAAKPQAPALVVRDILPVPEQHDFCIERTVTTYQCHVCKERFSDQALCESHVVGHLEELRGGVEQNGVGQQPSAGITCTVCHYWCVNKQVFNDHITTHPACEVCGTRFSTKGRLKQHYKAVHPRYQVGSGGMGAATEQPIEDYVEQGLDDYSGEEYEDDVEPASADSTGESEDATDSFKCTVCRQRFSSEELLTEHVATHPKCDLCDKKFTSNRELRKHNTAVHPKYRKVCEVCRRVFKRKESYTNHVLLHAKPVFLHGKRLPVVCHLCGEKFTTNSKLRNHNSEVHVIKAPVVCEICGKVYKSRRAYDVHMMQHTAPPKPIPDCGVCGEGFDNEEDLAKHILGHGLDQPLSCVICNQQYKNPANFASHLKEHANQPEQCLVCKETFPTYKDYKAHAATHSTARSECKDCGQTFTTQRTLVTHIKQVHTKEHHYKCEECGEGFVSKHKLQRHMQRHTGVKPYKCDYCDHVAGFKWDLQKHMGQHTGTRPHMCHQCGKTYPARAYLTHHLRTSCKAGPKTSNAKPRTSRAKSKPQVSTNEHGTYPCVICLDAFTTPGALTRHLKKQHPGQEQTVTIEPNVKEPVVGQPTVGEPMVDQASILNL